MTRRLCRDGCGRVVQQRGLCRPCYAVRAREGNLPAAESYGSCTLPNLGAMRISYRQLDYWTTQGYIHADETSPGSGRRRSWPDRELWIAERIGRLIRAGVSLSVAVDIARSGGGQVQPGVYIYVHDVSARWEVVGVITTETAETEAASGGRSMPCSCARDSHRVDSDARNSTTTRGNR